MKMNEFVIFANKNLKINMLKIKNIAKIENILIIHGNIEVLKIAHVIQSLVYLKKFIYFFTMALTMIIILLQKFEEQFTCL